MGRTRKRIHRNINKNDKNTRKHDNATLRTPRGPGSLLNSIHCSSTYMQLFSHHSSNPLEARSSDNLNADYNRLYTAAVSQQRANIPSDCILLSSEDPPSCLRRAWPVFTPQKISTTRRRCCRLYRWRHRNERTRWRAGAGGTGRTKLFFPPLSSPFSSPLTPLSSLPSSPVSSRPASPTESLSARPQEEQEEIIQEISHLNAAIPFLAENYQVIDRLGTGTFSSVYKAIDLRYDEWDNKPWKGNHPPESSAYYQSAGPAYRGRGGRGPGIGKDKGKGKDKARENEAEQDFNAMTVDSAENSGVLESKVYVAIKRIYTTSGPERIRNELAIMQSCRGCRHTSQLITAYRHLDQVVLVLPYQRNIDFRVSICAFLFPPFLRYLLE